MNNNWSVMTTSTETNRSNTRDSVKVFVWPKRGSRKTDFDTLVTRVERFVRERENLDSEITSTEIKPLHLDSLIICRASDHPTSVERSREDLIARFERVLNLRGDEKVTFGEAPHENTPDAPLDVIVLIVEPKEPINLPHMIEERIKVEESLGLTSGKSTTPWDCLSLNSLKMRNITRLPDKQLFIQFGHLCYENGLKKKVYRQCLDTNLSESKLMVLHGPPGSGKTSLAKSVGNLAYCELKEEYKDGSLKERYKDGFLVELACAQILSMYINQSDRNLDCLFREIEQLLLSHPEIYIVLLVDEIETIVRSRKYLISSVSTNSSLQLVNTMLVCLDRLRKYPNIVVFGTSNLVENVDGAFLDRADSIYRVDLPGKEAFCRIIRGQIAELMEMGVIESSVGIDEPLIEKMSMVCERYGMSGRVLVRLCRSCIADHCGGGVVSPLRFLDALLNSVLDRGEMT